MFTFEDCLEGGKHKAEAAAEMLAKIHPGIDAKAVDINIPMPGHVMSGSLIQESKKHFETLDQLIQRFDYLIHETEPHSQPVVITIFASVRLLLLKISLKKTNLELEL